MSGSDVAGVDDIHLQPHFVTRASQDDAARLGMWVFLATEILLFAGLFACYAYYRAAFPAQFAEGSRKTLVLFGTINTFLLVTSSFTVALAHHHVESGRIRSAGVLLVTTILLGCAFLGVKGVEYSREIQEGLVPGKNLFVTLYFATTGLHAIHVTAGLCVLSWIAARTLRKEFSPTWHTPVELGALYWHLVDLVWLFLFPLIYLVDRSGGR
jgi:cytochrome c oxidase subunit III